MAYLINIVDSTLVYTVAIDHIATFDKCIHPIYNDINKLLMLHKMSACVHTCVCNCNRYPRCSKRGRYWNTFGFLNDNIRVLLY